MFGSKVDDALNDKIVTIISSDVTIEGSVLATHAIRVDGIVNGAVRTKESVVVGNKAVVRGGIKASNLMSAGDVYGDVECPKGKVEISDTGRVFGDITAERLVIDENAVFQGKCTMTGKAAKPAGEAIDVPKELGAKNEASTDDKAADEGKTEVLKTDEKASEKASDDKDAAEKTEDKAADDKESSDKSDDKDKKEDADKTEVLKDDKDSKDKK
ncbi:MAG: polymer-forming cytoskeletal protein [Lachnospiraceae bacterium]|nr:polymer-forming cytoskeletal protein [Lachnospiraceae bacterium]